METSFMPMKCKINRKEGAPINTADKNEYLYAK